MAPVYHKIQKQYKCFLSDMIKLLSGFIALFVATLLKHFNTARRHAFETCLKTVAFFGILNFKDTDSFESEKHTMKMLANNMQ